MMWKLWRFLFGWDFVHLEDAFGTSLIRRVRYTAACRPYVIWFSAHWIWLDEPSGWKVDALTVSDVKEQENVTNTIA